MEEGRAERRLADVPRELDVEALGALGAVPAQARVARKLQRWQRRRRRARLIVVIGEMATAATAAAAITKEPIRRISASSTEPERTRRIRILL